MQGDGGEYRPLVYREVLLSNPAQR